MVDVLSDLEARAGASDSDREAWLAERRQGVTATEVKSLQQGGPGVQAELIRLKLGLQEDSFTGNAFTEWGKAREPVIAAIVQERYAIAPESRVFHAADNSRFLASPDGVGLTWDGELVVAEIKTAGRDMTPGGAAYERAGYALQQQWVMRVTGARRCLFVWEERIEVGAGQFEPGELHFHWVEYDEGLVAQLEATAAAFLTALDEARDSDGPVVDEVLDTHALNLLRFRVEEAEAKRAKESAWSSLHSLLKARGGDFTQRSALAQITYTAGSVFTADEVDLDAAREADPKAWVAVERARRALAKREAEWDAHANGFVRSVTREVAPKLTVTAVREKGSKK